MLRGIMSGIHAEVPISPLLQWWSRGHIAHQPSNCVCTQGGVCGSIESLTAAIAVREPVSRSTLFRRIQNGRITMDEADRWACALGRHPTQIWPSWERAPITASLAPSPPTGRTLF